MSRPDQSAPASLVPPFQVELTFIGDLNYFLGPEAQKTVVRQIKERTSVKDIIEACGIPHTEVDRIFVNGRAVDFSHVLNENTAIDVHSVNVTGGEFCGNPLQTRNMSRFVLDGHLGKLARNLRLLGFDVLYQNAAEDRQLLDAMQREKRALISRDRRLLMHSMVRHGYCPRSQDHEEQTLEVLRRFNLAALMRPFSRCLTCNAELQTAEKKDVFDQLEPLTKIYYEDFRRCLGCGKIYWGGSHFDKLRARVEKIRARVQ